MNPGVCEEADGFQTACVGTGKVFQTESLWLLLLDAFDKLGMSFRLTFFDRLEQHCDDYSLWCCYCVAGRRE